MKKWWAQSWLVGIPVVVCGYRDNEGIVKSLEAFEVADMPRKCEVSLSEMKSASTLSC